MQSSPTVWLLVMESVARETIHMQIESAEIPRISLGNTYTRNTQTWHYWNRKRADNTREQEDIS